MFNYQVKIEGEWKNIYPDGYGIHYPNCKDENCQGCWSPNDQDPEPWFDAINRENIATHARVLYGSQVYDERSFIEETKEE